MPPIPGMTPPAITVTAPTNPFSDLGTWAAAIGAEYEHVRRHDGEALRHATIIGEKLDQVWDVLKAGKRLTAFLKDAGLPPRTAHDFLTIYRERSKLATVASMGVAGVLKHLRGLKAKANATGSGATDGEGGEAVTRRQPYSRPGLDDPAPPLSSAQFKKGGTAGWKKWCSHRHRQLDLLRQTVNYLGSARLADRGKEALKDFAQRLTALAKSIADDVARLETAEPTEPQEGAEPAPAPDPTPGIPSYFRQVPDLVKEALLKALAGGQPQSDVSLGAVVRCVVPLDCAALTYRYGGLDRIATGEPVRTRSEVSDEYAIDMGGQMIARQFLKELRKAHPITVTGKGDQRRYRLGRD